MIEAKIPEIGQEELLDSIVNEIFQERKTQREFIRYSSIQESDKRSLFRDIVSKVVQGLSFEPSEAMTHPLSIKIRNKMQQGAVLHNFALNQENIEWFFPFVMVPTLAHSRKLEASLLASLDPFERNYVRSMNRQVMRELVKNTESLRLYISYNGVKESNTNVFSKINLHFMSTMLQYGIYEPEDLDQVLVYLYNRCNEMTKEQDSLESRMITADSVMLIIMHLHDDEFYSQMNLRQGRKASTWKKKHGFFSDIHNYKFVSRFFYGSQQFNPYITSILLSYLMVSSVDISKLKGDRRKFSLREGLVKGSFLNKELVKKIVQQILCFFLSKEDLFSDSIRMLDVRSMQYFKKNISRNNIPIVNQLILEKQAKLTRIFHKMLQERQSQELFERSVSVICTDIDDLLVGEDKNEIFNLQMGFGQVMTPSILFELLRFAKHESTPEFIDMVVGTIKKMTQRNYSAQVQLFEEFTYKHLNALEKKHPASVAKFLAKVFKKNLRAVHQTAKINKLLFKSYKQAVIKSTDASAANPELLSAYYYNKIFTRLIKDMVSDEEIVRNSALEYRANVEELLKPVIQKAVLPFLMMDKTPIHDNYMRQMKNKPTFLVSKSKLVEDIDTESLKVDLYYSFLRTFNRAMTSIEQLWFKGFHKKYFKERKHEIWLEKPHNYRIFPDLFLFEVHYYFRKSKVNGMKVLLAVKRIMSKRSLLRSEPLMVWYASYAMVRLFNAKKKQNEELPFEEVSSLTKSLISFAVKTKSKRVSQELGSSLAILRLKEDDIKGIPAEKSALALNEKDSQMQKMEKLSKVSQWRLEEVLAKLLALRSTILFRKAFSKNFEFEKIRSHLPSTKYNEQVAKFLSSDPAEFTDAFFCSSFSEKLEAKSQRQKTSRFFADSDEKKTELMNQVFQSYLESKETFMGNFDDNQITKEIKGSKLETPLFIQRLINVILLDVKFAYNYITKEEWQFKSKANQSLQMFLQMIEVYPGLRIKIFEKHILDSPIGLINDEGTYGSRSKAAATMIIIKSSSKIGSMTSLKEKELIPSFLDLFAFLLKSFRLFKRNRTRELDPSTEIACKTNELVLETILKLCTGNYRKLKTLITTHPLVIRPPKMRQLKKTVTMMDHFPNLVLKSRKAKGVFVPFHHYHLEGDLELVYRHHSMLLGMATEMCEGPCPPNQRLMRKKYCEFRAKPLYHILIRTMADDQHPVSIEFWKFKLTLCSFFLSLVEGSNKKNSLTIAVAIEPQETFLGIVECVELLNQFSQGQKTNAKGFFGYGQGPKSKRSEFSLSSLRRQYHNSDYFSSHMLLEVALKTFYLTEAIADQTYSHILAHQQLVLQWKSVKAKSPSKIRDKVMIVYGFLRYIATSIEVVKRSDDGRDFVIKKYTFSKLPKCFKLSSKTKEEFLLMADRGSHEAKISSLLSEIEGFDIEMTHLLLSHRKYPMLSAIFSSSNIEKYHLMTFVSSLLTNIYVLLVWEWVEDIEWTAKEPHKTLILFMVAGIISQCIFSLFGWFILNFEAVRRVEEHKYKRKKHLANKIKLLKPILKFFSVEIFQSFFNRRSTTSFALWLLTSILFLGVGNPVFLSLQLLSFINLSESCRYVLGSVTKHGTSILNSVILVLFIMYNFTLLLGQLYPNQLYAVTEVGPDGTRSDSNQQCYSLLHCLLHFILLGGVELGTISIMDLPNWYDDKLFYMVRFMVDTFSYTILGVLIFNALFFGIILDTFSEMRAAAEARRKGLDISTNCFICQLAKDEFEKNGLSFKKHQNSEHNIWKYVYFVVGLLAQDYTDLDGTEQYVVNCLKDKNYRWIPHLEAHSINAKLEEEQLAEEEEENEEKNFILNDDEGLEDEEMILDDEIDDGLEEELLEKSEKMAQLFQSIRKKLEENERKVSTLKSQSEEKLAKEIRKFKMEQKAMEEETDKRLEQVEKELKKLFEKAKEKRKSMIW